MLYFDITMSVDGFIAGPNPSLDDPLGRGGMPLHDWAIATAAWRERHGLEGGEENDDSKLVAESVARQGALIMGRRMFSGGSGPWEDDPNGDGWWGDDPPFRAPVFVLTHHAREPIQMEDGTTFHFVTDGIEAALQRALEAAGGRDVRIGGGVATLQQYLRARLIDELHLAIVPVLLGSGERLFDDLDGGPYGYECVEFVCSESVAHARLARTD
jgi:dihydrofolate reductase